ncbi:MAG: response regulator, partial [Planctomycetaceae bacterium]|nr:response regulator [Planctomycetaceae bacterium]
NAVKFTTQGEIGVEIQREAAAGQQVAIHGIVRDTGIGIAADKLATVFEAFRQSDSSTTRKFGGTGLGLNISVQLVELMGGRMWVESELGQGSEFHFVVPLEATAAEPEPDSRDTRLVGTSALVVSGNRQGRLTYQEMLDSAGCQVTALADLPAALAAHSSPGGAEQPLPQVAIVDLSPAAEPDLAAIEDLCRRRGDQHLPCVLLLPAGQVELVERCRHLGAVQSLVKPVKQSELVTLVQDLLAQSDASPVAPTQSAPAAVQRPLHILVADDSPFNQQVAAGLLELRGHTTRLASDGQEAIDLFQADRFDIIFMDVEMPEVDGLAATQAIRELEQESGGHVPIVGLSAHALVGFRERCLEAGMDSYITKPIQIDELYGALELAAGLPGGAPPGACVASGARPTASVAAQ